MDELHDALQAIYGRRAAGRYGLTEVSQLQHALQAAAIAERHGAGDELVVAALLHDVGHMIHDLGDDPARRGVDDRHEARGARFLARWFDDAVVRPVAAHVAAKRYLCAVDPAYPATLSDDSVRSLALQGGPMRAAEARAFEREPNWQSAVRLRRFDEAAKDPAAEPPPFEHFLTAIGRAHAAAAARRARSLGDA
jgi:phosphonate degradation associated HDIG domain protein